MLAIDSIDCWSVSYSNLENGATLDKLPRIFISAAVSLYSVVSRRLAVFDENILAVYDSAGG